MTKRLILVESPTKTKAVRSYAGAGYEVLATFGHIRDLPPPQARSLGVERRDGRYVGTWVPSENRKEQIARIRAAAASADEIFLATDPDREGEAIAWHTAEECRLPKSKLRRLRFHEITPEAVRAAISSPTRLDAQLVDSALARRYVDRMIGWEMSPVVRSVDSDLKSVGRVQSPTLKFVVDRERERLSFVPRTYWTLKVAYANGLVAFLADAPDLAAEPEEAEEPEDEGARREPGPKLSPRQIQTREQADRLARRLESAAHRLGAVDGKRVKKAPPAPFKTSSLASEAGSKLKLSAKEVMRAAQALFEHGFITYHRTDSVQVSEEGVALARAAISRLAPQALPAKAAEHRDKAGAQAGHECIRPTPKGLAALEGETVENGELLAADESAGRLLHLVRARFLASQSTHAVVDQTLVAVTATDADGEERLYARGAVVVDPGYLVFYGSYRRLEEAELPALTAGYRLDPERALVGETTTSPPPRYTEPTLVEKMEATGIGRPSTYAATINTLYNHGYIAPEKKYVRPTESGSRLVEALETMAPDLLLPEYTAETEERLDAVAEGRETQTAMLDAWFGRHRETLESARRSARDLLLARPGAEGCRECGEPLETRKGKFGEYRVCANGHKPDRKPVVLAGVDCPDCAKPMVVREGKSGPFHSCSGFPACKRSMPMPGEEGEDNGTCPKCSRPLRKISGAYGEFLGCTGYREGCRHSQPLPGEARPVKDPAGIDCPECKRPMRIAKGAHGEFCACTGFPECKKTLPIEMAAARRKRPARKPATARP